ncbi:MAG: ribosome assembly cofactor RimP [Muribaculaceae bacterium]|nr:ribosome assembly cofactor RimP [Muribaculaceae bacterium]
MIDKKALIEFVNSKLEGNDYFLVDVTVSPSNDIVVEIDSPEGVDIDFCCNLSRDIEEAFPRDDEDYSLEVGSAGLTSPFKVLGQYIKNIGQPVEVLTKDGRKLKGMLDDADEQGFTVGVETKVKEEGMKRPELRMVPQHFTYDQVKKVNALLDF